LICRFFKCFYPEEKKRVANSFDAFERVKKATQSYQLIGKSILLIASKLFFEVMFPGRREEFL